VSDQKTCPACRVRSIEYPTAGGIVEDRSCTGRAGCVHHPNRENPAPETAPTGADVPDGKEDLEIALRLLAGAQVRADSRERLRAAADEIARLRVEVERLARQVDHWIGCTRATETYAARLEDRRADLAARLATADQQIERLNDLALKLDTANHVLTAGIVRQQADRAARDMAVAEAVREACAEEFDRRADIVEKLEAQLLQANEPVHRDTVRNLQRYAQVARWVDIGPIVAAALKESAP
jgi:chromosome segregation ATPase